MYPLNKNIVDPAIWFASNNSTSTLNVFSSFKKIDYRLSAVGAIAFAFSSYFFIIIQAGHMTKAHAIAYVPMVVAAVPYT